MPQYFFDFDDGCLLAVDQKGRNLSGDEAARRAALDTLPDMARDTLARSDHRTFGVTVRNVEGAVVYTATLTLMGGWKTPKKQTGPT